MKRRVVILETFAGPLYWAILLCALWIFFRGHNEPGGGFIAGLVAVAATVLWAVRENSQAARRRLPLGSGLRLAAVGVLVSAASGLPGLLSAQPFLTHDWFTANLLITEMKLSSVLLFDLGVFLCVWGAVGEYALELIGLDEENV
jgi:multicomponent Na+:H+ antiporter subunit B